MVKEHISVAANVLGTIGTVLWCIQLIPQIVRNYRIKNCEGVPPLMFFSWSCCGIPFAIYFVSKRSNIPVQIQPVCFTTLCLITLGQALYYPPIKKPLRLVLLMCGTFVACAVGLEVGFVMLCRPLNDRGITWPSLIFGILAAIALVGGLVPPYIELWKRKGRVVGINFGFLLIDFSGAIFSLLSLIFTKGPVDKMGLVIYILCGSVEFGIFFIHFLWWVSKGRKMGKKYWDTELSEDELTAEKMLQKNPTLESGNDGKDEESFVKLAEKIAVKQL